MFSNDLMFLWPFQQLPTSVAHAARIVLVAMLIVTPVAWEFACEWAERDLRKPTMSFADAVLTGDAAAARQFLANGANPDVVIDMGYTPLMAAALRGDCEMIEALLDRGADPNQLTSSRQTALGAAAWSGHERAVSLLLSRGASVKLTPDCMNHRDPPLVAAARSGEASKEVVQILIDAGADLDACDDEGKTALTVAEETGRGDLVELLAQAGARHTRLARREAAAPTLTQAPAGI